MIRATVCVAIAALLAVLFVWFSRKPEVSQSTEPHPTAVELPASVVEPTSPADEPSEVGRSAPLRTEPNIMALITRQQLPDIVSPPWSDQMEATILSYIAQHPGLQLTNLQVQCAEEGCVILMVGKDVPVYEMDFDVFAETNGFDGAIIGGDGDEARTVALRR